MSDFACPNISSKNWLEITEKTNPFEAYRVFVRNGLEVPKFIFENNNDVEKYLNFIPQLRKRGDVWMIPYGKDYGTYTTNTSLVTAEVKRVNNIYNGLLLLRSKPVTKPDPRTAGRTKIEWVEINPHALAEHYKIYTDPRELQKEIEDQGIQYIPDYQQRVERPGYTGKELDRKVEGFWNNKKILSSDRNEEGEGSNVIMYESTFEGETVQFLDDKNELRDTLKPRIKPLDEGDMFDSLDFSDFDQRGSRLSPENRKSFEKKKAKMLKTFPRVTEVIEDYNLSQSGTLESNGTIIKVNPNLWTTDTIGHEFGHLLIDLIGGMSNPLVKKARKQLIGSDIETFVVDRYPDLVEANDGRIDKEIVAQAIGEETAQPGWKQIINRILDRIKKVLGIEVSAARELARIVLSGESVNQDSTVNINFYEQRISEKIKKHNNRVRKGKTEIEKLRDDTLSALEKKYVIYRKRDVQGKLNKLEKLISRVKELDDDPVKGLKLFQDFAVEQTRQVFEQYTLKKRKADALKRGEAHGEPFTLRELSRWKDYVSGFSLLKDLAELAEAFEIETAEKDPGIESTLNKNLISEAIRQRDAIEKAYRKEGTALVADFLAPYSKHIEAEYKEELEKQYNQLSDVEKADKTKAEYIEEQIGINQDKLQTYSKELIEQELTKAAKDINILQRWLDNTLDSPDVVVSAMTQAFVMADHKSRNEFLSVQDDMVDKVRTLEEFYGSKSSLINDVKGMYDFMLETDIDGNYTQNIVSYYRSSIWEEYNKFKKKLEADGLSHDKIENKLKKWKQDNMPIKRSLLDAARSEFYDELVKSKLITKAQKQELFNNEDYHVWLAGEKKDLDEIVSPEAAEKIHEWMRDNIWKFRDPKPKYKNPQFQELVKMAGGNPNASFKDQLDAVKANKTNDPRIDFYNFIVAKNDELQKGTPYGHRLHTRLPSVIKSGEERLQEKQSPSAYLKHAINKNLNVLADESDRGERILTDEAGNPVHFVPIYYTTNLKKYYENEYDSFSEEKQAKLGSKEDYATKRANEEQSYDLGTIYSRYFNSVIDYKHKMDILPEMEMARFLVSERAATKRDGKGNVIKDFFNKEAPGRTENLAGQLNDWFEALMYGIKEKDEGTLFGGRIDVAKAANLLNKYTALNMLGLNFVQGTANTILGSTMQTIESAGGRFYNAKDLAKANAYYGKNLPGILGDIGTRKPKNVVSLLLRKFDILNEYQGANFRKNSKMHQLLSTNTLFFTSHAGEHFMQTKVMLAMLNRMKAKDAQGNELGSMLEQYSVENGRLKLNEAVANFNQEQQAEFEARVRRILSSLHGEYSQAGRIAIQRYALGRMAYMFRKFVVPGIKRRYQKKQVNNALGEYVEGTYRTTGRFLKQMFKDLRNLQFAMMASDWNSMTDMEKANVRKTLVEFTFLMAAVILSNVFIAMKEDADDDEEWLWSFLGYQALRYKTELWFFANPMEAMKILRSPAASMSVIENSIKLIGQMMPPDFEGFERYERGNWKGRYKVNKTMVNFVPGLKQLYRIKYIDDQLSWFK